VETGLTLTELSLLETGGHNPCEPKLSCRGTACQKRGNRYFLQCRAFAEADEFLEFRVVVQAIGDRYRWPPNSCCPIRQQMLLERFEGLCFFP